uniref:Uncharacterized protein n=1 Tax=Dendroctonus ponderosae TaxID=77166 RepID=A0AAR5PTE3_DENPD
MERRNIRRNPRNRRERHPPVDRGADRMRQQRQHPNLPDVLEGAAALPLYADQVQAPLPEHPLAHLDLLQGPLEQALLRQNNEQLEHDRQRVLAQFRPAAVQHQQVQGIQIRPQGAILNLVAGGLIAGGLVGFHGDRPEVLQAQLPVAEHKQGQRSPQGLIPNIDRRENVAGSVAGIPRNRPEALQAQPPVAEHKQGQRSPHGAIPNIDRRENIAGSVAGIEQNRPEALQFHPPVAEHKQGQRSPHGAILNIDRRENIAGSVAGIQRNRPEALQFQPPVAEHKQGQRSPHGAILNIDRRENIAGNSGVLQNVRQEVQEGCHPVAEHKQVQRGSVGRQYFSIPRILTPTFIAATIPIGPGGIPRTQPVHPDSRYRPPSGVPQPNSFTQTMSTDSSANIRHFQAEAVRQQPVHQHIQVQGTQFRPQCNRTLEWRPIDSTGGNPESGHVQAQVPRRLAAIDERRHVEEPPAPSVSLGGKRRLQPQPSTSQQAASTSGQREPVQDKLRCNFCPLPATRQRVNYPILPHRLRNFDAITVDNLVTNFCKRVLATCPAARRYVRSIQSMSPNSPPSRGLLKMRHGPFCPIELIHNWPDPPISQSVENLIPLPENLKSWDPVSIKKAKKAYCREVLKHNPDALEELTGLRSISPDPPKTSESAAITDSVHHQDASCPLILFDKCLPSRSDSPPIMEIDSPDSLKPFKRATPIRRKKGDSLKTQTGCPGLPKPLSSLQSTSQGIAGPSQPTDPVSEPQHSMGQQPHLEIQSQQDCHLCCTASTSRGSNHPRSAYNDRCYDRAVGRNIMWGLSRELLLNASSDPERLTRASSVSPDRLSPSESTGYRSVVGPQTIQHHPLCIVPTLDCCPYCHKSQQHASSEPLETQNISEIPSSSRSSDSDSMAYVRITCDHQYGCPVGILEYCPECRVDPTPSDPHSISSDQHPTPSDQHVEAVEVEEQLHESGTSQSRPSTSFTEPTPQEDEALSSLRMIHQYLDDDDDDDDDDKDDEDDEDEDISTWL